MVHREMHRWICEYVFRNHMNADRNEMATELRISERMLDRAMKREDSPEARLVFELCLRYPLRQANPDSSPEAPWAMTPPAFCRGQLPIIEYPSLEMRSSGG